MQQVDEVCQNEHFELSAREEGFSKGCLEGLNPLEMISFVVKDRIKDN